MAGRGYRSPLGLNESERRSIRGTMAEAAHFVVEHKPLYTEGAYRWDGIANHRRYQNHQGPRYADCSAVCTWYAWTSTRHWPQIGDFVNGENWNYGYTGTMTQHGIDVNNDELLTGDMVFYGGSYSVPAHVAMCVGNGKVISHGGMRGDPQVYPTDLYGVLPITRYKRYIR